MKKESKRLKIGQPVRWCKLGENAITIFKIEPTKLHIFKKFSIFSLLSVYFYFLLREMFKILILTCLIIKTHSWTWKDYPSPRGPNYLKCGVSRPGNVCDPDGMLTDQQREEIVQLVEDFKEKTKRVRRQFKFH